MAEFKNVARAFLPGVASAERKLKDVEARVEDEDADRDHRHKVRGFERRTDEALSEGRAVASEFNLQQMKRAIAAAENGQILIGPAAARAIDGPPKSLPVIEAPNPLLPAPPVTLPFPSTAPVVSNDDIAELAARFARQAEGVGDPIERQRLYHAWSQDLRRAMPEFQASEVERKAREIINSYR